MAGVILLIAASCLIISFRDGRMSDVAPVSRRDKYRYSGFSIVYLGEVSLSPPLYIGIALAALAIILINQNIAKLESDVRTRRSSIIIAFVSGLAFGVYFSILSLGAHETNFWIVNHRQHHPYEFAASVFAF